MKYSISTFWRDCPFFYLGFDEGKWTCNLQSYPSSKVCPYFGALCSVPLLMRSFYWNRFRFVTYSTYSQYHKTDLSIVRLPWSEITHSDWLILVHSVDYGSLPSVKVELLDQSPKAHTSYTIRLNKLRSVKNVCTRSVKDFSKKSFPFTNCALAWSWRVVPN